MKLTVNWKALGLFVIELLKLIFSMYIIYILVDPHSHSERVLSGLVGAMWYVIYSKGERNEKLNEKK